MQERFQLVRAEFEDVEDDELVVIGGKRQVSVQIGRFDGIYAVNEYGLDDEDDPMSFWMRDHGVFRDKRKAMVKALEVADA